MSDGTHTTAPPVTVLMSVYNGLPEVEEAVRSILAQTFVDFEFLVLDDGSTDGSGAVLDRYAAADPRVRVIHQENRGLSPSLRRGVEEARGALLARQDADDVSEPERLARQVAFLTAHPEIVLLGTGATVLDEHGAPLWDAAVETEDAVLRTMLRSTSPFYHGSTMFRREVALAVGNYRTEPHVDDILLWRALAGAGRLANLPEPLYRFRLSPTSQNNLTRRIGARKRSILEALHDGGNGDIPLADRAYLESINRRLPLRTRRAQYQVNIARGLLYRAGRPGESRRAALRALRLAPLRPDPWAILLLASVPTPLRRLWFEHRTRRVKAGT